MKLTIHTLKPVVGSKHKVKKVGRGNASGHGNYSGHGGKGQTARSGGSKGLKLKGFKRQMQSAPKLRGFKSLAKKPTEIYLNDLDKNFKDGETVSLVVLQEKGLIKTKKVKVVNTGELSKKLVVEIPCTKGAAGKIKSLGGEVK